MVNKVEINRRIIAPGIKMEIYDVSNLFEEIVHDDTKEEWSFRLDFCVDGRFEAEFKNDLFSYIDSGEIAVNRKGYKMVKSHFNYGRYKGLSIFIEEDKLENQCKDFLNYLEVDLEAINNRLDGICPWKSKKVYGIIEENLLSLLYADEKHDTKALLLTVVEILYQLKKFVEEQKLDYCYFSRNKICFMKSLIKQYINRNPAEINLKEIVKVSGFTEREFYRLFKIIYKDTPANYFKRYHMNIAAMKLSGSDKLIYEIATECGYVNFSKFSKAFYRIYNKTPKEYRNIMKKMEHNKNLGVE